MNHARGFTLVEVMITVLIVAVLASAVLPLAEVSKRRAEEAELRHVLREIRNAIDAYKHAVDDGRIIKQADENGYPPDLQTLVDGVVDTKNPKEKIYFLRRIPHDPMQDKAEPVWGLRSYESPADDPQQGKDVFDVYSTSDKTGLNGVPYREW